MAPGPLGRVVTTSLSLGVVLAAAISLGPLAGAGEATVAGAALLASAFGWALMAVGTTMLTRRPQRWAVVPAAVLGSGGGALLATTPGEPAMTRLAWIWAPASVLLAVWVQRRTRAAVPGAPALLIHLVCVLMLLAGVGGMYEAATQPGNAATGAMPGRLVDVGGYRLHLDCTGAGSPTVVLLNGLQETSPSWSRIAPQVAPSTRVCSYDRAGQGWSDDSPHPADATHVAADLRALLMAAGEAGPFVLAGHSSGGVYALTYTWRYPGDVAGVVLLDSASPRQAELVPSFNGQHDLVRRVAAVAPTLARTGIWHLATPAFTPPLPGGAGQQVAAFAVGPRGLRNMRAEHAALPASFRQARALGTLGATPLVVLTAQATVDRTAGWGAAQSRLAGLSTNARHVVAPLDHGALLADPAGAALSVRGVTDVVTAARTGSPLTLP
jgi:pimeloyl-ACP methyl ester carboxylesterase